MAKAQIEPRVLKGFRDYLPQTNMARLKMIRTMEQVFTSFGFAPIDTPALEYADILLGKGSQETDKQLFRFLDNGERDVALRFDLTVPLARFAAMHINDLGAPFRRYHIAPVWRAEKPQRGRYREFMQCDVDILGTRSVLADAEVLAIMDRTLSTLDIAHDIRINNRLVLNGLLDKLGARERSTAVLRAIDKREKLGDAVVSEELQREANLSAGQCHEVFTFLDLSSASLNNNEVLKELGSLLGSNELGATGVGQLQTVLNALPAYGVADQSCVIDLSIARGLDYYTGTVFETRFRDLPEIGSIASGGRYDNLVGLYSNRELPGVGGSFGLDRILAAFEELGRVPSKSTPAEVLVTILDEGTETECIRIAQMLREAGIATELFPESKKLGDQLKYANRRGIDLVVIAGKNELANAQCCLKNMAKGVQQDGIALENLTKAIRS